MAKGLEIGIEQEGVGKTVVSLHKTGLRARDVRPLSNKIGNVFRMSAKRRFANAGDGSWPPLEELTRLQKASEGTDRGILRRTEELMKALTSRGGPGQKLEASPDKIEFGTTLDHPRYSDLGTSNEPRRRHIELKPKEHAEIKKLVAEYVTKGKK